MMKATMRPTSSVRARRKPAAVKPTKPYHHGSVHAAMLRAAERILERDGIQGLTLRAAARDAGVSHAAPKNHFGDLRGLLSELAAVGFERFRAAMEAKLRDGDAPAARMDSIGLGYVTFARAHPGLFLLMFRSERLDFTRPALRAASDAAFAVLADTVAERRQESMAATLTLPQAAHMAAAWSLVHGFAMLLIDGRLQRLMARLPPGGDETTLLTAMFKAAGLPGG
jgi:AcrR family transcriptional regulator